MTKIINLTKIVCVIKKFSSGENKITQNVLFEEVIKRQFVTEGRCRRIFYEKHCNICKKLDLIKEEGNKFVLTDFGQEYYDSIFPRESDDKIIESINPSESFLENYKKLKQKLIQKILDDEEMIKEELGNSLIKIEIKNGETSFFVTKKEGKKINKNFFELLRDLELISYENGGHKISSKIGGKIPKTQTKPTSEEELYDILEIQRKNGKKAEEATIEWERKRLRVLGVKESVLDRINRKSMTSVGAGYDIDSFDNAKIGMDFDRFIEVKATTGSYPEFYWSENERAKAKELGDKYFIYIWINFGKPEQQLTKPIQNPYQKIVLENYKKITEIVTWRVRWDGGS